MVPQIKIMHQGTRFTGQTVDPQVPPLVHRQKTNNDRRIFSTVDFFAEELTVMPNVIILEKTNLQEDCWHSMLISLLRGLAALQVAAAHLRAQLYPGFGTVEHPPLLFQGLAFSSGFAYLSVIVFFVLSGWLVGGSFLNKLHSERAFHHYAIDRGTRLWIVLLPTFLVVLLVGAGTGVLDSSRLSFSTSEPYSVSALAGNMLGLQTIIVPPFGGNFPLWSLANETWYYILFPLLVLVFRGKTIAARALAMLAMAAIAQLITGAIMLYFSIWLLGVAFSRVKIEAGATWRWALLLVLVGTAVYIRMKGRSDITPDSYLQYLLFSLMFVLFLSSMQIKRRPRPILERLDRLGRFFANFSFTLYVLHVPMIAVMSYLTWSLLDVTQLSPYRLSHFGLYALMYVALVVGAYWFSLPFEANTPRLRQWLKTRVLARSGIVRP